MSRLLLSPDRGVLLHRYGQAWEHVHVTKFGKASGACMAYVTQALASSICGNG